MRKVLLTAFMTAALASAPAFAQSTQSPQPNRPATGQSNNKPTTDAKQAGKTATAVAAADQHFVTDVAMDGMAEVELGQLAQQKAESSDVKRFAQRMVDDHGKANDELKSLASSKNITLPTAIDAKHKATHDRLAKLSGAAFDRAYMQAMVTDHLNAVKAFRTHSTTSKDADIRAFAAKTLPTLEDHLKEAQSANKAVATSGSTKSSPKGTSGAKDAPPAGAPPNPPR